MRDKVVEIMARAMAGRMFLDDAQAALTALEAAGFAVVPVEPTEGMMTAQIAKRDWNGASGRDRSAAIYRAMLKAAKENQP